MDRKEENEKDTFLLNWSVPGVHWVIAAYFTDRNKFLLFFPPFY